MNQNGQKNFLDNFKNLYAKYANLLVSFLAPLLKFKKKNPSSAYAWMGLFF